MAFLVHFKDEFCGEIRDIYAVNEDNPKRSSRGSVTTSEVCPHCKERKFYRVYDHEYEYEEDGWFIEVYECKCPSCKKNFDLKIEHEY